MRSGVMFLVGMFFLVQQASAMILPPNHLRDFGEDASNVSEEQFNVIVDHIVDMWKPYAKEHGATLTAVKKWDDHTVNAYADQSGNQWMVTFFGGLARRPEITPDGFALVVCHELGHHFGGYYFYGNREWAAAEGEADYWATEVCAKRVWASGSMAKLKKIWKKHQLQDNPIQKYCNKVWNDAPKQALCYRTGEASLSLAKLLGALGGSKVPSVETPDTSKVSRTNTAHPEAQCRLDTYMAGAVCDQKFDLKIIPGKDNASGNNSKQAEEEAAKYSCMKASGFEHGLRPRCWFRPQIGQQLMSSRHSDHRMM